MSTASSTFSSTYSVVDVSKVVDRFSADFAMLGQSTGCETDTKRIAKIVHDVKLMAQRDYLAHVDIVLQDSAGKTLRAARYVPSKDAGAWASDRPGSNLWPRTDGGSLTVVTSWSAKWSALSDDAKGSFKATECELSWSPSALDTNYPGLTGRSDRRYASNAYGLERTVFGEANL